MNRLFTLFLIVLLGHCINLYECQTQEGGANTTPSNSTTTVAPQTTTVAPNPGPPLLAGNITENGDICLRYQFNVLLSVPYNTTANKTENLSFYLPANSKPVYPAGICNNTSSETFHFDFKQSGHVPSGQFELVFQKNSASVYLAQIHVNITVDNQTFPNVSPSFNKTLTFNLTGFNPNFNVDKSHSYVCANNITIKDNSDRFQVIFSNLRLQAFMEKSQNGTYSEEHNCQNEINDVVPIAVGAALTGLVIIVMIAYFIGRRRSRRLAYQSV